MSKIYDELVQKAMIYVVKDALKDIFIHGKLISHEIYITFDTNYPEVKISTKLHNMYPQKLSILIQNNFSNLKVTDYSFSLELQLVTGLEQLVIPFSSITQFIDQTEKFALKFQLNNSIVSKNSNEYSTDNILEQKENIIKVDFSKE